MILVELELPGSKTGLNTLIWIRNRRSYLNPGGSESETLVLTIYISYKMEV